MVPDDKACTMAWDVSETAFFLRAWTRWPGTRHTGDRLLTAMNVLLSVTRAFTALSPRMNASISARQKGWPATVVPHTYCTIILKCHDQTAQKCRRTCKKPGHSCMRKIISLARPKLRAAGRAAAAWVECLRVPWECSSVKTSCADLRRSYSRACKTAGGDQSRLHCRLCGSTLSFPTVYTADAAQFYEEVRRSEILNTLKLQQLHFSERRGSLAA